MDNKRFKMFLGIFLIVAFLAVTAFYIFSQISINSNIQEYVPQQEISDEQFRQTFVKLYFKEINSNKFVCENRSIDSKELLNNPYLNLVGLLINGPSVEGLESLIPSDTKVISATLNGDTVTIDLSTDFINSTDNVECASNMVYSIVNTLTELTEVNSVKFLIDGNGSSKFTNCNFSLNEPFVRKL